RWRIAGNSVAKQQTFHSFERGDAVAALIFNNTTRQIILVEQFRPSTLRGGDGQGKIIETAAGIIQADETELECLRHEFREETGIDLEYNDETGGLKGVEKIATFYPSCGGSSERIHLYYVEIDTSEISGETQGLHNEGEYVNIKVFTYNDFTEKLRKGEFTDSKILIGGYWLLDRVERRKNAPGVLLQAPKTGDCVKFDLLDAETNKPTGKTIGYFIGDIGAVKGVDVWVSNENTYMLMDRIFGDTLSARIRTLGARRYEHGERKRIARDTIQEKLTHAMSIGSGIDSGEVVVIDAGRDLLRSNGVKRLVMAAAVEVEIGNEDVGHVYTSLNIIERCVRNALEAAEGKRGGPSALPISPSPRAFQSILIPLLGAGSDAQINARGVVLKSIEIAIEHLSAEGKELNQIFLLAYSGEEIEICDSLMSYNPRLRRRTAG
ncbi:MAG: NUDIX hydrolase, partial [Pseudomonadota bacterium]